MEAQIKTLAMMEVVMVLQLKPVPAEEALTEASMPAVAEEDRVHLPEVAEEEVPDRMAHIRKVLYHPEVALCLPEEMAEMVQAAVVVELS